jgi:hypothetical protein
MFADVCRHERVRHLIYPSNSVLDDSIGCAVWFAARGKGLLNGLPYTTTARVSFNRAACFIQLK